jgi:hypothetical protein
MFCCKRTRELQKHQHCNANGISNGNSMDKLNSDGSVVGSPARMFESYLKVCEEKNVN